jgi:hypothetical protein
MKIRTSLLLTAAALGAPFSQAATVIIANHSFESAAGAIAPGSWSNDNPESWTSIETGGQIGLQADNPPPAGTDGAIAAFVQGDTSSLTQDITLGIGSSAIIGDIFTLTIAALNQNASPSFDFDITNFSGGSLIGGAKTTPIAGGWADYTVSGTVDSASSEIRLVLNSNGPQVRFDNVRLDFQAVPEPSLTALLGLTGFALMVRRRRLR